MFELQYEVIAFLFFSSHTKDVEDLTADNKYTCGFCKTHQTGKLYYNVQLVCRENYFSNKLISIYLSTFDNQGNGFFSIPAADFYRNSNEYQKLKQNVESLIKPEVYISVLVQAIKTEHSECDRVYRIIGEYQNKLN